MVTDKQLKTEKFKQESEKLKQENEKKRGYFMDLQIKLDERKLHRIVYIYSSHLMYIS